MRLFLPLIVILVGLGGGVGAGILLKSTPSAPVRENDGPENGPVERKSGAAIADPVRIAPTKDETEVKARTYVSVGEQTIVPVVDGKRTRALMLFELAVDVEPSGHDLAVMAEPRLRDAFLRVLLRMSSTGAFTGTYTEDWVIDEVRRALSNEARRFLGDALREVLVLDLVRQEF